ncbi:cathepsin L-like proteinase isoform X1 [Lepeophtheirus salmonis]|uniref:cathepsin L-like proteinase isoform X1 n=1 Tax=Lepeophtheirus salmonis TaxID=72036 RepID=UPI001AE384A2|nr:macrodontain-1-like [Lepeophtheirus salmonis]
MICSSDGIILLCFFLTRLKAQNVSSIPNETQAFNEFVKSYNRSYEIRERDQKKNIFLRNLRLIRQHNAKPNTTYKMGVNQFTDVIFPFRKENSSFQYQTVTQRSFTLQLPMNTSLLQTLSKEVDWRNSSAIGEVRAQMFCGSCWAFALAQTIASYIYLKSMNLPILSVQHLTSCASNPYNCGGSGGCDGSINVLGYAYISLYGLALEKDYPYISGDTENSEECTFRNNKTQTLARISGYEILPSNDMLAVLQHLDRVGPLTASVDSSAFYLYKSGIHEGCDFTKTIIIDHEVQLVGYGNDSELGPYWLIRNSWGKNWGEEGYIRLKRYSYVKCGYDFLPSLGTGCPMDLPQYVCGNCGILFQLSYPIGARLEDTAHPFST